MHKLALSLLTVLVIAGCGKKEEPKVSEVQKTEPVAVEPGAAVTFVKGPALVFSAGAWKPAALNDRVLLKDSIDLAAKSELEVNPDSGDAVKLAGPLKGLAGEVISQKQQADKASQTSGALTKIKKIQGTKQTLTTQTPTAVAGIRGTAGRKTVPPDTAKTDSTSQ